MRACKQYILVHTHHTRMDAFIWPSFVCSMSLMLTYLLLFRVWRKRQTTNMSVLFMFSARVLWKLETTTSNNNVNNNDDNLNNNNDDDDDNNEQWSAPAISRSLFWTELTLSPTFPWPRVTRLCTGQKTTWRCLGPTASTSARYITCTRLR